MIGFNGKFWWIVKIEKNWKMDTLNWHFLKFKYLIVKVKEKLRVINEVFSDFYYYVLRSKNRFQKKS